MSLLRGTKGSNPSPSTTESVQTKIAELNDVLGDPDLYARDPRRFGETTEALAVARDGLAAIEEQ